MLAHCGQIVLANPDGAANIHSPGTPPLRREWWRRTKEVIRALRRSVQSKLSELIASFSIQISWTNRRWEMVGSILAERRPLLEWEKPQKVRRFVPSPTNTRMLFGRTSVANGGRKTLDNRSLGSRPYSWIELKLQPRVSKMILHLPKNEVARIAQTNQYP